MKSTLTVDAAHMSSAKVLLMRPAIHTAECKKCRAMGGDPPASSQPVPNSTAHSHERSINAHGLQFLNTWKAPVGMYRDLLNGMSPNRTTMCTWYTTWVDLDAFLSND